MSCNFKEYFKNKVSKACILTLFETIWNANICIKTDGKWCILTVFKTIRNFREKMKTRMITGAFYGN